MSSRCLSYEISFPPSQRPRLCPRTTRRNNQNSGSSTTNSLLILRLCSPRRYRRTYAVEHSSTRPTRCEAQPRTPSLLSEAAAAKANLHKGILIRPTNAALAASTAPTSFLTAQDSTLVLGTPQPLARIACSKIIEVSATMLPTLVRLLTAQALATQ